MPAPPTGYTFTDLWTLSPGVCTLDENVLGVSLLPPVIIQAMPKVRSETVVGIGDSLMLGSRTVASSNCYGWQVCSALSTLARPVSWVNSGWGSQYSTQYAARAAVDLPKLKPSCVLIPGGTPNDSMETAEQRDAAWQRTLDIAAVAT
ncbi:hypothetical protein, partial [Rhodoplanes sp. SY1]|uniref:hypothetical protein n=1 Tax=Rhodoplanes sp. SY1 TaxID=3166646 RepID=UPI0038B51DF1